MRFRDTIDELTPEDRELLLNRLTLGCGRVAYAARLALGDAASGAILDMLAAAHGALAGAEATLGDEPPAAPASWGDGPGGEGAGLRGVRWAELLAARPGAEAAALTADLAALAHQTRELGRAVGADADTGHVRRHLDAILAALTDVCGRLAAAVEP